MSVSGVGRDSSARQLTGMKSSRPRARAVRAPLPSAVDMEYRGASGVLRARWGCRRTNEGDVVELVRLPATRVKVAGRLISTGSGKLSDVGEDRLIEREGMGGQSVGCCCCCADEVRAERGREPHLVRLARELDDSVLLPVVLWQGFLEDLLKRRLVVQDELCVCDGGDGTVSGGGSQTGKQQLWRRAPLTTSLISPGGAWRTSFDTRAMRSA